VVFVASDPALLAASGGFEQATIDASHKTAIKPDAATRPLSTEPHLLDLQLRPMIIRTDILSTAYYHRIACLR